METGTKQEQRAGWCPKCGSFISHYESVQHSPDGVAYPYRCGCGFRGLEEHTITFSQHLDQA